MATMLDYNKVMVESGLFKETNGPNRSPELDKLNAWVGVVLGSPWCASFQAKASYKSKLDGEPGVQLVKTASSQFMLRWFQARGWTSNDPQDLLKWGGAMIIRTDPGGIHGHVALVRARFTTNGRVISCGTYEGNTDRNGSRNGDGAYSRVRVIPLTPYKWTFCNLTEVCGGRYWPMA